MRWNIPPVCFLIEKILYSYKIGSLYFLSPCKQLYEAGLKSRPGKWSPLQIVEFHEDLNCAHEYICRVPQLPFIIK